MRRILEPEILDVLPPGDSRAIHSRRDLRLINRWMRNASHLWNAMRMLNPQPRTIVELGSGDGTLMLRIAALAANTWKEPVRLLLLDKEPVTTRDTLESFAKLGWTTEVVRANLHDWAETTSTNSIDLIVANLFLHHFSDEELRLLFSRIAPRTRAFVACEPIRSRPALLATYCLWILGCNHVTRNDATISVRAGFRNHELSDLWPKPSSFALAEGPAGYASHIFRASKMH
jgi:hypothetical protein